MSFSDDAKEEKIVLIISGGHYGAACRVPLPERQLIPIMPDHSSLSKPAAEVLNDLREMLHRRLALIADAELRASDPARQLDELRRVSEEITAFHGKHESGLPAKLNHFLERASFQKALEFVDGASA